MKENAKLNLCALGAGIWALAFQLAQKPAEAAESIGAKVYQVCDLSTLPTKARGKEVSVYGEIRYLTEGSAVIRDRDFQRHAILVDIRHIPATLRARLSHACSASGCSELVFGRSDTTIFRVTASYAFESSFQSPLPCPEGAKSRIKDR